MNKLCSKLLLGATLAVSLMGFSLMVTGNNKEVSAEDFTVTDIVETFENTDFCTAEGVTFAGGNSDNVVLERYWVAPFVDASNGITFNAQFASNEWNGTFKIFYGASEIFADIENGKTLKFSVTNVLSGKNEKYSVDNYNASDENEWTVSRVYGEGDNYELSFALNGITVWSFAENSAVRGDTYHYLIIRNETGIDVTVRSTIENKIEYEKETNVLDIANMNGNAKLFSSEGLAVKSSVLGPATSEWWRQPVDAMPVEVAWVKGFTSRTDGMIWQMRAEGDVKSTPDAFKLEFGATDIRIGYDSQTKKLSAWAYTKWSESDCHKVAFGGGHLLAENYDFNEWHTFKITRVKATNRSGYAVRFYIDGQKCLELFCAGELANTTGEDWAVNEGYGFHAVRFVNLSGNVVYFKSANERILPEAEVCRDILEYGGSLDLLNENGRVYSHGQAVLDTQWGSVNYGASSKYFAESNGIEFAFKAEQQWPLGPNRLKIQLGATDIRLDKLSDGSLVAYCYDWGNDYGVWGSRTIIAEHFNETEWHTLKITRRKLLETNGSEGEIGFQLNIYLDGERVFEKVGETARMYTWLYRYFSIVNLSNVDVSFKSLANPADYIFEEENITDLTDLYKSGYIYKYYEDAFTGLDVAVVGRIVDNLFQEEFASCSNGAKFILTSEEPWITSGTAKNLVELSESELATLHTVIENGKPVEKFTQDNGQEGMVVSTGTNGLKYKLVDYSWTSDFFTLDSNYGGAVAGETNDAVWTFDPYWRDSYGYMYFSENNQDLIKQNEWRAYYYHLHIDFGPITIAIKLTPQENIVFRVTSSMSGLMLFEDYARDEYGTPIVLKTGKYEGEGTTVYNGETMQKGDYYKNKFEIYRVQGVNVSGFAVRIKINDHLVCNVYDNEAMGNSTYKHFLIDNSTGRVVKAWSCKTFDEYKDEAVSQLQMFTKNEYSNANMQKVNALITEYSALIRGISSITEMRDYTKDGISAISKIWTIDRETEFAAEKAKAISALNTYIEANDFSAANRQKVEELYSRANAVINALAEPDGFDSVAYWGEKYLQKIQNITTLSYENELVLEKNEAKARIDASFDEIGSSSQELVALKMKYLGLIEQATRLGDPEIYALLFETESHTLIA